MPVLLKIRFNKKTDGIVKNKEGFFPVTLKASFLTLTLITLPSNATGRIGI